MLNEITNPYAIVLAGHGSRDGDGVREFEEMVTLVRSKIGSAHRLDHGYLEFAKPTISQAIKTSIQAGSKKIVVVPALLFAATHAKNDMPYELNILREEFPEIEIHFGASMDLHPKLLQLAQNRIIEGEATSSKHISRSDTCLVVVGRGTTDPDANSEISKLCRMLEEGMGFGASFVTYSGTARPFVANGLKAAAKLGLKRIIILPFLLFDGILIKRIYQAADILAARHPEIEVLKTNYMGVHPLIADVFIERAQEGIEGRAHMNCSLCKYRVQIVGFERQKEFDPSIINLSTDNGDSKPPETKYYFNKKISKTVTPFTPYEPHPIEQESFRIIEAGYDWSGFSSLEKTVAQRVVHTSGDFNAIDDLFFSPGATETGVRAILRCRRIITDVSMVEAGIKKSLINTLQIITWCGVHEQEVHLLSAAQNTTRSAAGIRLAFEKFGNDLILAIGDAPTAVFEAIRLINNHSWRPQLIIGLPVGFVGTVECKEELKRCLSVPRITNAGHRGGSPWASAVVNALLIEALNQVVKDTEQKVSTSAISRA